MSADFSKRGRPSIRAGIVGAGSMAGVHIGAWHETGAETVVYSPSGAGGFAAATGSTAVSSLEELLETVDVVDVCTPTPSHGGIVTRALMADRDVICEKPLSGDLDEARQLMHLADERGRTLFPAHVVRYFPQYWEAKMAVNAGRLGELAILRFTRTGARPTQLWYLDEDASGGIILDQLIHDIDQAVWLAGPVASVYATANSGAVQSSTAETVHVVLTHTSGAVSHCRGVWGLAGTEFSYGFHIAGTGGVLRYSSERNQGFSLKNWMGASGAAEDGHLPEVGLIQNPYRLEIEDFIQSISSGSTSRINAAEGVYAVEIALAANQSVRGGESVSLNATGVARP